MWYMTIWKKLDRDPSYISFSSKEEAENYSLESGDWLEIIEKAKICSNCGDDLSPSEKRCICWKSNT